MRTALPERAVLVRACVAGTAAWLAALVVLVPFAALLLGPADAGWDTGTARAGTLVVLWGSGALAAALGGGVGTWQAAGAGAQSRGEALAGGALAPALLAGGLTLAAAGPGAGGIAAAVGGAVVVVAAALGGAAAIARRLG